MSKKINVVTVMRIATGPGEFVQEFRGYTASVLPTAALYLTLDSNPRTHAVIAPGQWVEFSSVQVEE